MAPFLAQVGNLSESENATFSSFSSRILLKLCTCVGHDEKQKVISRILDIGRHFGFIAIYVKPLKKLPCLAPNYGPRGGTPSDVFPLIKRL